MLFGDQESTCCVFRRRRQPSEANTLSTELQPQPLSFYQRGAFPRPGQRALAI